ncbi:LamG-like jellyroll fold domain-containing protein [Pelosinus sp. IPA-1]|uniref:LamG-like jellyroll fold domain-containing protein n=1 Tax=Pelosinus sp. IPA-1 TaxID=3029569 RepID=UPI0024362531|nr:LamG-like jellyroll fold domain-containing protein [Pelosinus sp. IPA-1]GMB01851.1 hypothetical protein PIPA1_46510 [Pelosinus sp. IPA-1]
MYEVDQYTVSLLHFDEGLKDECGKVWSPFNGATISTVQSKFGGASLYLNGTDQYLTMPNSTDFDFGTGDFTIDWWEYRPEASPGLSGLFSRGSSIDNSPFRIISDRSSGNVSFWGTSKMSIYNNSSYDIAQGESCGTCDLNQWNHIAIARKGNNFYTFKNGVIQTTFTNSGGFPVVNDAPLIGKDAYHGTYFAGYIDEFRVSKGIARWTSNFTPPSAINAPTNLTATAGDSQVSLLWAALVGATGYNVKRSTNAGGPYTTIATKVTDTKYVDNTVTNGTTYYYVVTAVDASGNESANSNEASATPQASSGNGLLRITMSDSSEREYRLSKAEIESFIKWCDRTVSTGNTVYTFDDTIDRSKEYLLFDKIISFKVIAIKD